MMNHEQAFGVYSVRYHLHKADFYTHPEKYIPEFGPLRTLIPGFEPPALEPSWSRVVDR